MLRSRSRISALRSVLFDVTMIETFKYPLATKSYQEFCPILVPTQSHNFRQTSFTRAEGANRSRSSGLTSPSRPEPSSPNDDDFRSISSKQTNPNPPKVIIAGRNCKSRMANEPILHFIAVTATAFGQSSSAGLRLWRRTSPEPQALGVPDRPRNTPNGIPGVLGTILQHTPKCRMQGLT